MHHSSMRRTSLLLLAIVLGFLAGIMGRQSPIDPVPYSPPVKPRMEGRLEPNKILRGAVQVGKGVSQGPEDMDLDGAGWLYFGAEDRTIRRARLDESERPAEDFASVPGRPLGLDFDRRGILWVAASEAGLVAIDRSGEIVERLPSVDGAQIGYANDVAVAADA